MNLYNALRILSNPATNAESIHSAMTGLHRLATRLHEQRGDAAKAGDEKRLSAIPHPGEPFSAEEQQAFDAAMADLKAEVLTPVAEFVPAQAPAVPQETFVSDVPRSVAEDLLGSRKAAILYDPLPEAEPAP